MGAERARAEVFLPRRDRRATRTVARIGVRWSPTLRAPLVAEGSVEPIGSTWGGTACMAPRKPSAFAAVSDDGSSETILRCADCPGCREFERRRLCQRLRDLYKDRTEPLWILVVAAPLAKQAGLLVRIRRWRGVASLVGFYRLGKTHCATIVLGDPKPVGDALVAHHIQHNFSPLPSRLRNRSFRDLAAGILMPREDYGEQRNRFYHRGLPKAERDTWRIETRAGIRTRHPGAPVGTLAWRDGVSVVRPLEYSVLRLVSREPVRFASSPVVHRISDLMQSALDRAIAPSIVRSARVLSLTVPALRAGPISGTGESASRTAQSGSPPEGRLRKFSAIAEARDDLDIAEWGRRMAEKARARGRGGGGGG